MNSKKAAVLQIGVALLYAISILISSSILQGTEDKDSITFLFIGLWFMTSSLITSLTDKKSKLAECKSSK